MHLAFSVLGYLWLASVADTEAPTSSGPEHWLVVPVEPVVTGRVPQIYSALEVLGAKTIDEQARVGIDRNPNEDEPLVARADDVRATLLVAKASLRKLQIEEVEKALELALAQFLRLAAPETQSDLLSDVLLMRAELFLATQRRALAIEDLRLLARVDARRKELHPGLHPPALVEAYAEARLQNQEAKLGTLVLLPRTLQDIPPSVRLDGASVPTGTSNFAVGPHLITMVATGAPARSWIVRLDESRPTLLDPFLAPSDAQQKREALLQRLRVAHSSHVVGPWSPEPTLLQELANWTGAQVVVCMSDDALWVMRIGNSSPQGPFLTTGMEAMGWASVALSKYSNADEVRGLPLRPLGADVLATRTNASSVELSEESADAWLWWTLGTSTVVVTLLGGVALAYAFWPPADIPAPPRPIVVTCCTKGTR